MFSKNLYAFLAYRIYVGKVQVKDSSTREFSMINNDAEASNILQAAITEWSNASLRAGRIPTIVDLENIEDLTMETLPEVALSIGIPADILDGVMNPSHNQIREDMKEIRMEYRLPDDASQEKLQDEINFRTSHKLFFNDETLRWYKDSIINKGIKSIDIYRTSKEEYFHISPNEPIFSFEHVNLGFLKKLFTSEPDKIITGIDSPEMKEICRKVLDYGLGLNITLQLAYSGMFDVSYLRLYLNIHVVPENSIQCIYIDKSTHKTRVYYKNFTRKEF